MKSLLFSVLILIQTIVFGQIGPGSTPSPLSSMVQNPPLGITTWRTILPNPIYDVIIAKGTESWTNNAWSIVLPNYATLRDDGFPKRIVYIDSLTGALKVSGNYALDSRYLKIVDFNSSPASGITSGNISNWNTAYGWGNHAGLYPTYNGADATGTWGISISGNSGTVTNGLYSTGTYSNPSWITSLSQSKITYTGTTAQYVRGDGSIATFPSFGSGTVTSIIAGTGLSGGTITTTGTISLPNTGTPGTYGKVTTDAQGRITSGKRQETYSGTTSVSGTYTVTFSTPYSVAPNIQAGIVNGTDLQMCKYTISTTGFTVTVREISSLIGLLPSYSNVNGALVDVLITEK